MSPHADGDYGTRFLATGRRAEFIGRLLHAYEAARGRKSVIATNGFALTHFQAFLLFAAVISSPLVFLGRRPPARRNRIKYILWSFFLFLAVGIGIAWAMYPFRAEAIFWQLCGRVHDKKVMNLCVHLCADLELTPIFRGCYP